MNIINIIGFILAIWGSLRLVNSNKKLIGTISTNFEAIELSLTTLSHAIKDQPNNIDELGRPVTDVYIFQNWKTHYSKIKDESIKQNNQGILLLVAGFSLQLIPEIVKILLPIVKAII